MDPQLSAFLALWASILSTALAGVKIFELWRDRARLETSYSFSAPGHGGNQIIIENPSKTPVLVTYWELYLVTRNGLKTMKKMIGYPVDTGYCDIIVKAHERHVLNFDGDDYFNWGISSIGRGVIYLDLHISGRKRPLSLRIYSH